MIMDFFQLSLTLFIMRHREGPLSCEGEVGIVLSDKVCTNS